MQPPFFAMPFQLLDLREEDCAAVAEMDELATRGWPLGQAMDLEAERQGVNRKQMIEGMMMQHFKEPNPNSTLIKIVDSDTGSLVSFGLWSWQLEETEEEERVEVKEEDVKKQEKKEVKVEVAAPAPEEGAVEQAKEEKQNLFSTLRAESEKLRAETYGNEPHFKLQLLITHPDWRRQGAGSMLIEHGCKMADEHELISVLTSSSAGYRLYERHGFKTHKYHELDLRPFGVDASEPRRLMIREPRRKVS